MNNIKCIIFDFDDTIVYSEQMKVKEFFNISKQYGRIGIDFYNENINKRLTRYEYFNNLSKKIINNTLLNKDNSKLLYHIMLKKFTETITQKLKETEEILNIKEFLEFLKKNNYKIFISSKSNTDDIINTLEHKKILKYFNGIYGLNQSKIKHFNEIMKEKNFTNKEICFIGDSYSDYEVAKEIDCEFIGILTERDDLKNVNCLKINYYQKIFCLF